MLSKPLSIAVVAVVLVGGLLGMAVAAEMRTIDFQGFMKEENGRMVDGPVNLKLTIYSSSKNGTSPVWQESQTVVVQRGYFSVRLGKVTPIDRRAIGSGAGIVLGVRIDEDQKEMTFPLAVY